MDNVKDMKLEHSIYQYCDGCRDGYAQNVKAIVVGDSRIVLCKDCRMRLYKTLHQDLIYDWEY